MIDKSSNKSLFKIIFWIILYFNAFKNNLKVSNAWIVQPQTVEKKLHAPLISPNLGKKKHKKIIIIPVNILLHICFITFLMR